MPLLLGPRRAAFMQFRRAPIASAAYKRGQPGEAVDLCERGIAVPRNAETPKSAGASAFLSRSASVAEAISPSLLLCSKPSRLPKISPSKRALAF